MAGLLSGCVALPGGLVCLPARSGKGSLGVQPGSEQQQPHLHQLRSGAASCFAMAAAEGLVATPVVAELACGGAGSTTMAVGTKPPRTHTRRLVVPAYALAGTRTRRRRGGGLGGGDDEEAGGGGGDDGGFWGGDGGSNGGRGGDFWGAGDDEASGDGNLAVRLQTLLLLWSLFSGMAFCQTVWYVSPKPKAMAVPPAFAALSYSGIKASLLQQRLQPVAC